MLWPPPPCDTAGGAALALRLGDQPFGPSPALVPTAFVGASPPLLASSLFLSLECLPFSFNWLLRHQLLNVLNIPLASCPLLSRCPRPFHPLAATHLKRIARTWCPPHFLTLHPCDKPSPKGPCQATGRSLLVSKITDDLHPLIPMDFFSLLFLDFSVAGSRLRIPFLLKKLLLLLLLFL